MKFPSLKRVLTARTGTTSPAALISADVLFCPIEDKEYDFGVTREISGVPKT